MFLSIIRLVVCDVLVRWHTTMEHIGIPTFRVHRASSMVQLRISSLQRSVTSTPSNHFLNETLPRGLLRWEFVQELYQALWSRGRRILIRALSKQEHPCSPPLTLSSPALGVIIITGDLPLCLVVHFRHQHDRQISTACRGALLSSGPQQSCGATSQEVRRRIIIRLLDIPHSNDTQLLMSFVVGARRDPRCRL